MDFAPEKYVWESYQIQSAMDFNLILSNILHVSFIFCCLFEEFQLLSHPLYMILQNKKLRLFVMISLLNANRHEDNWGFTHIC